MNFRKVIGGILSMAGLIGTLRGSGDYKVASIVIGIIGLIMLFYPSRQ